MHYIEILHVRKMLLWFLGIVCAIGALLLSSNMMGGHVHIHSDTQGSIPAGAVFVIAAYASCVFTTMISATLNRDRAHLPYIWTTPIPRERIAIGYVVVDLIGLLIGYVAIAGIAYFAFTHVAWMNVHPDPDTFVTALRYFSIPLMWYGLIEVVTSWNSLKGPMMGGISWGVFWVLLGIAAVPFPSPIREIIAVLNLLNPLALFTSRHGGGIQLIDAPAHTLPMDFTTQTLFAYGVFFVAISIAIAAWKRMEV